MSAITHSSSIVTSCFRLSLRRSRGIATSGSQDGELQQPHVLRLKLVTLDDEPPPCLGLRAQVRRRPLPVTRCHDRSLFSPLKSALRLGTANDLATRARC